MTWTKENKKIFKTLKLQYETAKRLHKSANEKQIENIKRQCEIYNITFENILI